MIVTTWKNGKHAKKGTSYGLRIGTSDREKFFDREWEAVVVEFEGSDSETVVNVGKGSFWTPGCGELISTDIRDWLYKTGVVDTWEKGHPPRLILKSVGEARFRLQMGTDSSDT